MRKIKKAVRYTYHKFLDILIRIIFLRSYNIENVFVIFSEGRSGSTWLMEIINHHIDAFINWEPLHPWRGVISKKYGPRPSFDTPNPDKFNQIIKDIIKGKKANSWTVRKNRNIFSHVLNKKPFYLIKFIRASRLIPEIFQHISFINKPVVLLRHPIAVISSVMKRIDHRGTTKYALAFLEKDRRYIMHKNFFDSLNSTLEFEFAWYCLNNYHIYNTPSDDYVIVYYEELIRNTRIETERILSSWDIETQVRSELLSAESSETTKDGLEKNSSKHLGKWKDHFSETELNNLQDILVYFKIVKYNIDSIYPINDYKTEN